MLIYLLFYLQVQCVSNWFYCTSSIDILVLCSLCEFTEHPSTLFKNRKDKWVKLAPDPCIFVMLQGWRRKRPTGRFQLSSWSLNLDLKSTTEALGVAYDRGWFWYYVALLYVTIYLACTIRHTLQHDAEFGCSLSQVGWEWCCAAARLPSLFSFSIVRIAFLIWFVHFLSLGPVEKFLSTRGGCNTSIMLL